DHDHDHDHDHQTTGAGDQAQTHAAEGHADLVAEYRFRCARPAELTELRVTLFERFPAIERLQVQVATDRGQGRAELTPSSPVVKP
ncbi:MAG: ZrgA family zinc uptake protein, partial [Bdellovibrio bacteriovorus]